MTLVLIRKTAALWVGPKLAVAFWDVVRYLHFSFSLNSLLPFPPREITIPAIVRNRSGNSDCPHAKVSASMECRLALWKFLKKLKIGLPYDPAIPLLGVYPNNMKSESLWYLHFHGHSSTIYNSQNMETTQVSSMDHWRKKMWYMYVQ